ncbi:FMN-linked oxidoreductase [Russula vinacea]|nr:FMN-linked oxidoreductase [Russula vinacea]
MTRLRANAQHVNGPLDVEYYKQRTSVPGTLAITGGTIIAAQAGGYRNITGIWNDEQIKGGCRFVIPSSLLIVDAVHKNGSFIFMQIVAVGRGAFPDVLQEEGGYPLVAPSPIPLTNKGADNTSPPPIGEYVQLFATAARNAVHGAGFDGVEIHAANGFLPDQFLQTNTNSRTDLYGGSVENRMRFVLEVTEAIVNAVGANKVGIRLSPWSTYQEMRMADPLPTFAEVVKRIRVGYPDFAYLHIIEPTTRQWHHRPDRDGDTGNKDSSKPLRDIWGDGAYIANSDFGRDSAIELVEKEGGLVSFGRHFISNPDLPIRLRDNIELAPSNSATHYTPGPEGYIDYPFATEAGVGVKA